MDVEVQSEDMAAGLPVAQHALGPVAEGQDADAVAADRDHGCDLVHLRIVEIFGADIAPHPGVEDAGTIDAEQDAQAVLLRGMVDVGEGVDPGLRIIVHLPGYAVYDAGRAGGRGDLSRLEDIEGQGVVGLVSGAVGDRGTFGEAQFFGGGAADPALLGERGYDVGEDVPAEAEFIQQEIRHASFLEVPEHALGQAAHGRAGRSAEFQGDVVARQHDLVDAFVQARLILLDPGQLGGGEIAGRVEQVGQAAFFSEMPESLLAVGDGPRVAPDDRRAERLPVLVHADQAVHLVGDADGSDGPGHGRGVGTAARAADRSGFLPGGLCQDVPGDMLEVLPPHLRFLFGPSGLF